MSLLLSGPRLSHCDCQALGLEPPGLAVVILAASLLAANVDTGGLWLPLAISLIRSSGFLPPPPPAPALPPISRPEAVEAAGFDGEAIEEGGMPNCNLVKASGVRFPVAKSGCRKGQAPRAADSFSLSVLPNLGILGPPGLKLSNAILGLLLPERSKGDSASLEGDLDLWI